MTDQTQPTRHAIIRTELDAARRTLLLNLMQLIRAMRSIGAHLPCGTRMRRDIGLPPEHQDPREKVMREMTKQGIHF